MVVDEKRGCVYEMGVNSSGEFDKAERGSQGRRDTGSERRMILFGSDGRWEADSEAEAGECVVGYFGTCIREQHTTRKGKHCV